LVDLSRRSGKRGGRVRINRDCRRIARLGGAASRGCVRLHPSHAAALFALVGRNGPRNTRIEISNWNGLATAPP
jgi:lipoprotein-anchoring transpeptidase ErfK/SrfK